MKKNKKYSGIIIPAVTPLTTSLELDIAGVGKLMQHFADAGVHPFIAGTTGEATSLSSSLRKKYAETAGQLKTPGTQLYVGISSLIFQEAVDLANHAFDHGADVAVATLPSYYALTESEMLHYFERLADAARGSLMIYNIPATTHMSIPLELIEKLSHHEKIVGIKDSERSDERLQESLQRWSARDDFSHLLGWAARSVVALKQGGDGLVPSTGNLHPALYAQLVKAVEENRDADAEFWQKGSDELGNLYQAGRTLEQSLGALKLLLEVEHICGATVMPPLQNVPEEEKPALVEAWQVLKETYATK